MPMSPRSLVCAASLSRSAGDERIFPGCQTRIFPSRRFQARRERLDDEREPVEGRGGEKKSRDDDRDN